MGLNLKTIPLSNSNLVAYVDDQDYDRLVQHNWTNVEGYARCHLGNNNYQKMHHAVIGSPSPGFVVAHRDHNKLNNCKENLELVTNEVNLHQNGKGFHGVVFHVRRGFWQAFISKKKVKYFLGTFVNIEDAARAYDKKALELYGDKANLNFPLEQNQNADGHSPSKKTTK